MDLAGPSFLHLFALGAAARNDNVKLGEVEFLESSDAQHRQEFVEFFERSGEIL